MLININNKIHFKFSKSQLLCFNTSSCTKSKDIKVYMRDGSVIPYLDTCTHLGNILYLISLLNRT